MHENGITRCILFCVCPFSLSVIPIHASNILYWFVKFHFINGLIFLQMDIKMVSTLGLLWIKVLWKYLYVSFCGPRHSFPLRGYRSNSGIFRVQSRHMFCFYRYSQQFSRVGGSIYTPISDEWAFQLLYILTNTQDC